MDILRGRRARRRALCAFAGLFSALCLTLAGCSSNSGTPPEGAKFKGATPPADFIAQKMKLRAQGPQPGASAAGKPADRPAAGKSAGP